MNIQTKFKVGDKAWCIYKAKAAQLTIQRIDINVMRVDANVYMTDHLTEIVYTGNFGHSLDYRYSEEELFATKEELINQL